MNSGSKIFRALLVAVALADGGAEAANDVVPSRLMGLDLARDIAGAALSACRKDGY